MTTTDTKTRPVISSRQRRVVFWGVLLVGAIIRLINFPNLPLGFNQDEISAGYESYSLLHTGAESWGTHWPVYFTSGGGGQNVLYAYLNMPFLALFGMTALGTRTLAVILGILTLPLLYATVKRWYGVRTALIAMSITALIPWHVMLSRWGLESNILPIVLLLGAWTVTVALQNPRKRTILPAIIPWAFALYAYGLAVIPVFFMLVLGFIFYFKKIRPNIGLWLLALIPAFIIVLPYLLFLGNAYLKLQYPFEKFLPFGFPDLNALRLNDLQQGNPLSYLGLSVLFLITGSNDKSAWNGLQVGDPVPTILILFVVVELFYRLIRLRHKDRQRAPITIFDIWLIACVPLLAIIPVNLNEANSIYLPVIVIAAVFTNRVIERWRSLIPRFLIGLALALSMLIPLQYYFSFQYAAFNATNFNPDLPIALQQVTDEAAGKPIYVEKNIPLNYLQVLWYQKIQPETFRAAHPTLDNPDFENYVFSRDRVHKDFWYVTYATYSAPCNHPTHEKRYGIFEFKTGYCATS